MSRTRYIARMLRHGPRGSGLPLAAYDPQPKCVVASTHIERPTIAAIDAHNHLGRWLSGSWMTPDVDALLRTMDACGVERMINLDGRWGDELTANLDRYDRAHPGRFATFAHIPWSWLGRGPDSRSTVGTGEVADRTAGALEAVLASLEDSAAAGARGVKIWKDVGLRCRRRDGTLLRLGDPEVVAVVRRAGELGLPVMVHSGDPAAFFDPADQRNERLEELTRHPQFRYADRRRFPSFDRLLADFEALLTAAPQTTVIGAHVGNHAEDLGAVSAALSRHPRLFVDLAGRLAEIGRTPRAFADLVAAHPTRILFGTDAYPVHADDLRLFYRFLETGDEHFPHSRHRRPAQGRWRISGAALPPQLLTRVYRDNALTLGL